MKQPSKILKPPDIRAQERYDTVDTTVVLSSQDASTDKHDYLVVFPVNAKVNESSWIWTNIISFFHTEYISEIAWSEVEKLWRLSIPGSDATKVTSVNSLQKNWDKFPTTSKSNDARTSSEWKAIARDAIIEQLYNRSGLQLKLSSAAGHLFCRIRAPIKLLELQAKREGYRLQFKGEIDPGSESFWNREINGTAVELIEERKKFSRDEANAVLLKLLRTGKISPLDAGVNKHKETMAMWSRRIHALERIADKVPVLNNYPAYAPFTAESHLRYLYQMYPSVRGKTLFRAKDRLYLTKAIIDRYFDMGLLQENGLIECFMALHDANRGEKLTIDILQRRWSTFWRVSAYEVGSPLVTHEAYEEDKPLSWYLRPFAQPLSNIREYFGEQLALHYAWLGCYTYSLCIPAVGGIITQIYESSVGYTEDDEGINAVQVFFIFFMIAWSVTYLETWKVQQKALAIKWGTSGFEEAEKDRPQFKEDRERPFKRSFISNQKKKYFPEEKRNFRELVSIVLVTCCIIILVSLVAAVYYFEYYLTTERGYWWGSTLCSLISAIQIRVLSYLYGQLAEALNNWENHRTQTEFEDNLIFKTFFFELFNSFAALTYTCFFKGTLFNSCTNDNCIADLKSLLVSIYILRYVIHIFEVIQPILTSAYQRFCGGGRVQLVTNATTTTTTTTTDELDPELAMADQQYLNEFSDRSPDKGTYPKYAEMVLQYGYLSLFALAWPLIFFLSLLDNLLVIRVSAWKQCELIRRPDVYFAEDVGMWMFIVDAIGILGIFYNVAIFCFTGNSIEEYSILPKIVFLLAASQVLFIFKVCLHYILYGIPKDIQNKESRQKYIIRKFLHGYDDLDESPTAGTTGIGTTSESGGGGTGTTTTPPYDTKDVFAVIEDQVDVDGMTLYDFRKEEKMTKMELRRCAELEKERRAIMSVLTSSKQSLQTAYKMENYNSDTGVGETKDGIPLGLLHVTLLELTCKAVPNNNKSYGVIVKLVGIEKRADNGKVIADDANTKVLDSPNPIVFTTDSKYFENNEVIKFNQVMGPFAPVRTIYGEIVFELHSDNKLIGKGKIPLESLSDQMSHEHMVTVSPELENDFQQFTYFPTECQLKVNCRFQFSKIVSYRRRVEDSQKKLNEIETTLSLIKAGATHL